MKLNFVTLFPGYYKPFAEESIVKRAIEKKLVEITVVDFRQFASDKHKTVDDVVYGGGKGMLLKVEPIDKALQKVKGYKVLLSPQGRTFTQDKAKELAKLDQITFVAGRYEGFDERVRSLVDEEISIGDYVLTGGELPSMVVADAIIRLLKGVIQDESHMNDSFENNLLDYPQYTKPRVYKNMQVPPVLLGGNHEAITTWRKKTQRENTQAKRPDLMKRSDDGK